MLCVCACVGSAKMLCVCACVCVNVRVYVCVCVRPCLRVREYVRARFVCVYLTPPRSSVAMRAKVRGVTSALRRRRKFARSPPAQNSSTMYSTPAS